MRQLAFNKIGLATLAIATCIILIWLSVPVRETNSHDNSWDKVIYELHQLIILIESNAGEPKLNIPQANLQGSKSLTALLNGRALTLRAFPFEQVAFIQEKGATYVIIPGFKDTVITAKRINSETFVEVRTTHSITGKTLIINSDNLYSPSKHG